MQQVVGRRAAVLDQAELGLLPIQAVVALRVGVVVEAVFPGALVPRPETTSITEHHQRYEGPRFPGMLLLVEEWLRPPGRLNLELQLAHGRVLYPAQVVGPGSAVARPDAAPVDEGRGTNFALIHCKIFSRSGSKGEFKKAVAR